MLKITEISKTKNINMNQTQEQILHYARLFLQSKGYNGFSYRDIAQKLDIKNAAIHNYYPKKEDLVATLLEESRKEIAANFSCIEESGGNAREQLQYYFESALNDFDEKKYICLPGSIIIYFEETPEKVKEQTLLLLNEIVSRINFTLENGRKQGEFKFSGSAEARAKSIVENLIGARQLSSIKGRKTLATTITLIKADIGWKD